ncbi:MAG TPA: hypothetical protein VFA80_09470 [Xanthobacteraceae bacterium]|nr:hypothetical protein [Xanthobacteraceae bacterium]
MKIVHADEVEWKRGLQHRGGTFHYRHLLNGTPGTPGNFQFNIGQLEGDFSSPRHRHNFDQFRFQLEGTMNFDRNGKMGAGSFGYFPEGAPYGPQSSDGRSSTAVLQFGGASGSGYLSREEVAAGTAELKKYGTFEAGIFRRNDDVEGRRATDGYQAIWEHAHGERMEYPKPRYRDPIMVDPANYEWLPFAGQAGVTRRSLGTFTERQCAAELVRLERGAAYRADGRSVYLVLRGAGIVGDATYRELSAFHLEDGERAELVARDDTEILRLVLPDLTGIVERRPAQIEAAE